MALSEKVVSLLTRSPASVVKEQIKKLYLRLYPYIVDDFVHKEDLKIANETIYLELEKIKKSFAIHIHATTPLGASLPPAGADLVVSPSVIPSDKIAKSFIVREGVPQPTGAGISYQPSRIDTDPISVPPINPIDPSV